MKKKIKEKELIIILCCISIAATCGAAENNNSLQLNDNHSLSKTPPYSQLSANEIAETLGWISQKNINICNGYYYEPEIIKSYPQPKPIGEEQTTITATQPASFSQFGVSTVKGNVTITQPGRKITADEVDFYRDKAGKITNSTLIGNVHFQEYGKLIVAKKAHWDFDSKKITLYDAIYRLLTPAPNESINAWGNSRMMVRDNEGDIKLKKASYSTCPPTTNTWKLWGNNVDLNKNTGRGTITNALFYVKDTPVFYLPYFNFPIDKRRKSGFLYPTAGYSSDGIDFSLPYYLNLAPNYDATLTPRYISDRGLLTSGLFRYLTPENNGYFNLSYIPHDSKFIDFKNDALTQYAPSHTLDLLENANNDRAYLSMGNKAYYNQNWSSSLDVNYVSDNYFFQDFGGSLATIDQDQLLNQLDLKYDSENWNLLTRVQSFQTLDTVTENANAEYQYRRLPQIDLKGDYPNQMFGLDLGIANELVNFDFDHFRNPNTGDQVPIGTRVNIQPNATLPIRWVSGYFTPEIQLQETQYNLSHNVTSNDMPLDDTISRTLPIFNIDSGLFFNREINLFNNPNGYIQTLEPRIFYLFVPDTNQNDIPLFDTNLNTFSFDQLFQTNRFSGLDRVGDANQISVALTTRILNGYTSDEEARASIGQIYQFHEHEICLNNDCSSDPLAQDRISPMVGELQYNLTRHWEATAGAAWDMQDHTLDNDNVTIKYHDEQKHIASLGYNFVKHGDIITGDSSDNLDRINLALSWPVFEHFNLLGNVNYNISHEHSEEYFYGAEYESCCWAIRVVQSETYIGTDENDSRKFNHAVYLQFLFKGLGNVGTSNAHDLLISQIPYYVDQFSS